MSRKHRVGRVSVDFSVIREFAASEAQDHPLRALAEDWRLTRHSAVYRRKDGSYTICLIWHSTDQSTTLRHTVRGVRLEVA